MSEFFESDIVREELSEINKLQEEIYGRVFSFGTLSNEDKKEHIDDLIELLDKQRIMYARVSLSDDPEAIQMRDHLKQSVQMLGYPTGTDINVLFDGMDKTINDLKKHVD